MHIYIYIYIYYAYYASLPSCLSKTVTMCVYTYI